MNVDFYNEAFHGYNVPNNLKRVSTTICEVFSIKGICDPVYIANVTAHALGTGDGQGNFHSDTTPNKEDLKGLAERIVFSYGTSIQNMKFSTSEATDYILDIFEHGL